MKAADGQLVAPCTRCRANRHVSHRAELGEQVRYVCSYCMRTLRQHGWRITSATTPQSHRRMTYKELYHDLRGLIDDYVCAMQAWEFRPIERAALEASLLAHDALFRERLVVPGHTVAAYEAAEARRQTRAR